MTMNTKTIIVADRDEDFRRDLSESLARSGRFQVLASAHDDSSLFEAIHLHRPGVILLDSELAAGVPRVRAAIPSAKIVILSDDASPEAGSAPAAGILSRSRDAADLVAELDRLAEDSAVMIDEDGRKRPRGNRQPIPEPQALAKLSPREQQVLEFVAASYTSREIAETLGITQRTVEVHRHHMLKKLGLRGVADLVKFAIRAGLTDV